MRERPMIFGPESVRALLAGTKTQTRRVVTPQPLPCDHRHWPDSPSPEWLRDADGWHCGVCGNGVALSRRTASGVEGLRCPYGAPGDRLWVREGWTRWCSDEGCDKRGHISYRADASAGVERMSAWRSPLLMPRWASRLTLEVVAVRVERLHAIQEDDARAEGVTWPAWEDFEPVTFRFKDGALDPHGETTLTGGPARCAFERAWDALNAKRGFPWASNPWVWAVTFKRVEGA